MGKAQKILDKMRSNPKADWNIDQVRTVAKAYDLEWTRPQGGSSHETYFHHSRLENITVVDKKPIKPFYIKRLVDFIDNLNGGHNNDNHN